ERAGGRRRVCRAARAARGDGARVGRPLAAAARERREAEGQEGTDHRAGSEDRSHGPTVAQVADELEGEKWARLDAAAVAWFGLASCLRPTSPSRPRRPSPNDS